MQRSLVGPVSNKNDAWYGQETLRFWGIRGILVAPCTSMNKHKTKTIIYIHTYIYIYVYMHTDTAS